MAERPPAGTATPGRRPAPQKALRRRTAPRRRTPSRLPYGRAHQLARQALLAVFRDGQRCPRCRKPMRYYQKLDAGHAISRALGGARGPLRLEHASCNRSAGATLGNAMRKKQAATAATRAAARAVRARSVKSKWA